jgi:integrase/recombinase XerD
LLLRYSVVRIRDAATLSKKPHSGDKLFLYTAKTGTPVYCPLPPFVIEALNAIPESTYFFWTGLSTPKTAAGIWQESLKRLFVLAVIPDGHAHRFGDTFSG